MRVREGIPNDDREDCRHHCPEQHEHAKPADCVSIAWTYCSCVTASPWRPGDGAADARGQPEDDRAHATEGDTHGGWDDSHATPTDPVGASL